MLTELSTMQIFSPHRYDGDKTPQDMVIDMKSDTENRSPVKPTATSPSRLSPKSSAVKRSPVKQAPAADSAETAVTGRRRDRERRQREEEKEELDKLQSVVEELVKQKPSSADNDNSPYSPSKGYSNSGKNERVPRLV